MNFDMTNFLRIASAAILVLSQVKGAYAASAADLDNLNISAECTRQLLSLFHIVEARDKGVTKSEILAFATTVPKKDAIPEEIIEQVFAYPGLGRNSLGAYSLWACHARTYGVAIAPLNTVEGDLSECIERRKGGECDRQIRNKLLGLPENFTPYRSAPPAAPSK